MKVDGASRPVRRRLELLTADDRPDAGQLIDHLREVRRLEDVPVFSLVLHGLAHLEREEDQAEQLVLEILRHRDELSRRMRRDPGLRVAALDLLSNVKRLLSRPTILESAELRRTERSATTDSLTGLFNRAYFHSSIRFEIRRSERYGLRLSLLFLDLDGFKQVNDEHGHPLGDVVLQRVGRTLRRAVRDSDVACRYGGEEFAVILPETSRLGAFALGERIRRRIERDSVATAGRKRAGTTVSGGIASLPDDGDDAKTLLERADEALYLAKRAGRNRIVMYHSERRNAVRYPARRRSVATLIERGGSETAVKAIDVSTAGALFEHGGPPPDERASVSVRFGGVEGAVQPRSWTIPGTVVRVDAPAGEAGRRVAVAFREPVPADCLAQHVVQRNAS